MAQAGVLERTVTHTNLAPEARCLYDIYKKEGDVFYCRRKYKKALLSYNEALRLANRSAQTLVARSRCYMGIGMMQKALDDTESALSISGTYLPAVYQKAQILYRQGNYEMALMMFTRGHKLSPSAPGFLEGIQKSQHAMEILATGRTMKTTVVGDLSLYIPKKTTGFPTQRRPLPELGKSGDSHPRDSIRKSKDSDIPLPSPGFPKRHKMLLLNTQRRQPPAMGEARYGREGNTRALAHLDDRAMRDILGQLYDDKQYFERILNTSTGPRGDDLSGMLNTVLEDGLKFLYDRVLFWAQNDSMPPAAPPPAIVNKHYKQQQQQQQQQTEAKSVSIDADTVSGEQSDAEDSSDELYKVSQAIDAVSSVNDPESISSKKKRKLLIRKRRADILKKRASMVVVHKRKPKKIVPLLRDQHEEDHEANTPSRIQFHFSSLMPMTGREEPPSKQQKDAHVRRSLPEGSKVSWEQSSTQGSGLVAVDDMDEERKKKKEAKRRRKLLQQQQQQQQKDEEQKSEVAGQQDGEGEEPREDPLAEYLDKVMSTMEELYQKGDLKALKTKAESFLLTMERYDSSIVGTKMAYVGRAHSYLGNAHLGMRHYDFAMMHHNKDLEIGQRWQLPECESRALGNIGRTYIATKKYPTALKYLAQKSKMVSTDRETAWLYHEIASCFLQLHHFRFAQDAVSKALSAATQARDSLYLMQANVLQGAIQVKLHHYEKAYASFEQAMDQAKLRDDRKSQQAITEAMAEVNEKIARQARERRDRDMAVIAAAQASNKEEVQPQVQIAEAQGDAQEANPEAEVKTEEVKQEEPTETQKTAEANHVAAEADAQNPDAVAENPEQQVESDRPDGVVAGEEKKSNPVSAAASAANTGEDPELLALVSDEEGSTHGVLQPTLDKDNGHHETKDPASDSKHTNKPAKEQKKDKEEPQKEDKAEKQEDAKTETEEQKEPTDAVYVDSEKSKESVEKEEASQLKAEKQEAAATDKQDVEADKVESSTDDKQAKEEETEQQQVGVAAAVEVEVRPPSEPAEAKEDEKETGVEDKEHIETEREEGLDPNVGPEATYKERPITAESLAKSMAKDRGIKHAPDQAMITLNKDLKESVSREASRLLSADPSVNKVDKKVTISESQDEIKPETRKDDKGDIREQIVRTPQEPRGKDPITDRVEDELKLMAKDYNEKDFDKVLKRGGEIMKFLKRAKNIDAWSKRRLMNFAKVHSYLGSASSEKQNFDKARQHHHADLKIGEATDETYIQSRALEHLGRTFIFENKHDKALEYFAKRARLPRDTEDTARLFHEIANCFFLLKAYEFAKDAAMVSLKAANEGGHTLFQLQSSTLIAVMKVKLNRVDTAFETFEEALKYAQIRDDAEAADAIRGAMKQIEDRVAGKVRDKWLAKIGKKPTTSAAAAEDGSSKEKKSEEPKEKSAQAPSVPSISGIIKSMKEEDRAPGSETQEAKVGDSATTTENNTDKSAGEKPEGELPSRGKTEGSESHRSDFLAAPEGALERRPSAEDRIIKVDLPEGEARTTGPKKKVKKKTGNASTTAPKAKAAGKNGSSPPTINDAAKLYGKASPNKKTSEKEKDKNNKEGSKGPSKAADDSAVDAAVAVTGAAVLTSAAEQQEENAETQAPKNTDENEEDGGKASDTVESDNAHNETEGKNMPPKEETEDAANITDVKETIPTQEANILGSSAENASPKFKTVKQSRPSIKFMDKSVEDEIALRMKLRTSYVAPKPKVKPQPAVISSEDDEKDKKALMERRKSQRFIGLDPKKVAEAKEKGPQPIKEIKFESAEQPKPKTKRERFVGLKVKPSNKTSEKSDNSASGNDDVKVTENAGLEAQSSAVPKLEIEPAAKSETLQRDMGYDDANMPSEPLMALNEEAIRKDSVGSRHSIQRPATRMSLAEIVKDDTEVQPKGATKAELSALHDLVQDSIRLDRKKKDDSTKVDPIKLLKKPEPTVREKRLAEERAAAERARRRRFLLNQKASFLLMLNSPYAEISTVKRRSSQWFPLLRKRYITTNPFKFSGAEMAVSGEGLEMGKHQHQHQYGMIGDGEGSPRKHHHREMDDGEAGGLSPRKHSKDMRKTKKDLAIAAVLGHDPSPAEVQRLEIAAKEMRRKERDNRREERRKLQEAERKRRQVEREETELLKLTPRTVYPNPYNKPPSKIPGLEQHYNGEEDDNLEMQWRREGERMLRREKLRVKREKEVQRLQKDEARKRKFDKEKQKKTRTSPSDKPTPDKEESTPVDDDKEEEEEMTPELTSELSPEVDSPLSPGQDEEQDEEQEQDEEEEEPKEEDKEVVPHKVEEPKVEKEEKKKKKDKKQEKEKPAEEKIPEKEEEEKAMEEPEKEQETTEKEKEEEEEEKPEEEAEEEDEFDGYNDDEEDKEDDVAVDIEREARIMRADYNKGEIDAVIDRGVALLKSLRKYTDIVSWSRRRLRWFGVAHSYLGSAFADKKNYAKAKSHHQADYRIGEALHDQGMLARALEHLARIAIAENEIPKALEYLAKRAHLPRDSETSARIYQDMGNCFLKMGAFDFARDAAVQSVEFAKDGGHATYALQGALLLAICQAKLREYDAAKSSFESALADARALDDNNTEASIKQALEQLEVKRATMVRDKWKGKKLSEPTPITGAIAEEDAEEAGGGT